MRKNIPRVLASAFLIVFFAGGTVLARADAVKLQWFGQAAFKITTPGGMMVLLPRVVAKQAKPDT